MWWPLIVAIFVVLLIVVRLAITRGRAGNRRPVSTEEDRREAADIEAHGRPGPHSHGQDGDRRLPGLQSLLTHLIVEHRAEKTVQWAMDNSEGRPPNYLAVTMPHLHAQLHAESADQPRG